MLKKIILIVCFLFPVLSQAQLKKIDSLYRLLTIQQHDTLIAKLHYKLGHAYLNEDVPSDTILSHYKTANAIAHKEKFTRLILYSYRDIGDFFITNDLPDSAIKYFMAGLPYVTDKKNGYMELCSGIGNGYFLKGNYIKSYEYFLMYLKQAEISGNLTQKLRANSNVGVIFKEQKKYDEALPYFEKALNMALKANDPRSICISYINIGNVYADKAKAENKPALKFLALENYNKAKPLTNETSPGIRSASIMLFGNIGNIYADIKQYDKAIEEFNHAIKLMDKKSYFPQSALIFTNLAGIYTEINDLKNAKKYLDLSKEASLRSGSHDNFEQMYYGYSKYYDRLGDYKNAYKSHVLYKQYSDSLFNSDNSEKRKELELNFEFEKKEAVTRAVQERKEELAKKDKQKQLIILYAFIAGFILMVLLAFFIYKGLRNKQKANKIIERQKNLVEEKQKEILDSIHYAQRIQQALLASKTVLDRNLKGSDNYFVLFKPKDIVSGDFYWATEHGDYFFLAVCDSTGHGVPGAFMSLLNIGFMSEAINENEILDPGEVFNYVRKRLISSISDEGQKDGFDGVLLRVDKKNRSVLYAASQNKPVFVTSDFKELPCEKMPVGKGESEAPFKTYELNFLNGYLYLYTDGYPDQFGGVKGKKFKYKPLNEMLVKISSLPADKQKEELEKTFTNWQGQLEQVDDVLIIGIKI